ncbi:hypothetical protein [Allokutzneria albata]|uniref:Uncharacterized protein n=1 Tax=Allokutzneria albata TaxID=211114 RepID=A0A1G9V9D6_ALLAB|nr:hypothetical protein [Allokutzneria albata]SDM68761.1 hypothetical protein SAMN04489726_2912 [Allokutzneria albata]
MTINGATVELDAIIYGGSIVRTAYPADANKPGKPNDPNAVFVNPELPADIDSKLGDVRRNDPARYDKNTGTFTLPGGDADGIPVIALDVADALAPPPLSAPVVPC